MIGGRDTLALLPTGGGKSAIYQLAAAERPGPTIVVSPLLALQRDQLEALEELDIGRAEVLNSTVTEAARREAIDAFAEGRVEFLLLAPEQLALPDVLDRLAAGLPSLFVVDEAHCLSEWGHDFRPEYRRLRAVAERLGRPPILGLTATASPAVREEIVEWLGLRDPAIVARGFDRPNLRLSVETFADAGAKRRALVAWAAEATAPGIVYAATRAATEAVADDIAETGRRVAAYHAGLGARRREAIQDDFMAGRLDVVVATIAFGMGVDKPDVRFVAHHDPSDGLDAYHQEIGRAGRDGEASDVRLFYRPDDLGLRRFQGAPARLEEADVRSVVRALGRHAGLDTAGLARVARRSRRRIEAIVARLEAQGRVDVDVDGSVTVTGPLDPGAVAADVVQAQERRRTLERTRVDMLRGYAETTGCRRRYLLNYLGEEYQPPCDACDRCLASAEAGLGEGGGVRAAGVDAVDDTSGPFRLNERVRHVSYGAVLVSRLEGDRIVVAFDDAGYRVLDVSACLDNGLLAREA